MDWNRMGLRDWKRLWRFKDQASRNLDIDSDDLEPYEVKRIKNMWRMENDDE